MSVLVTGGAGYIGSHVVKLLCEANRQVIVLDNITSGTPNYVPDAHFIRGDLSDIKHLNDVFRSNSIDAVLHFAGAIEVGRSFQAPLHYYRSNVANTLNLLDACNNFSVPTFIFSSTAAVYGIPERNPIDENVPANPVSPYGRSKLAIEHLLNDYAETTPTFNYVSLRYFNAAGADPTASIGEQHDPETHLIPIALQVASGRLPFLTIFGSDYDTSDGTAVRDYIHVNDLAQAHLDALEYLELGGPSAILNAGYGEGYTVLDVLRTVEMVTGRPLPVQYRDRRLGDPAALVADPAKLIQYTNWTPRRAELSRIIEDAWRWECRRNT